MSTNLLGVPEHPNIVLDFPYVKNFAPMQINLIEIVDPNYEEVCVLTILLENRNQNPIDRDYSIERLIKQGVISIFGTLDVIVVDWATGYGNGLPCGSQGFISIILVRR